MQNSAITDILNNCDWSRDNLVKLLSTFEHEERSIIFEKARTVKLKTVGNKIFLRGLIEYSNICRKNCLYCGIRNANDHVNRYILKDEDVLAAARYAYENNYASIVIQSGEMGNSKFVDRIAKLIEKIHSKSNHSLRITLSCGEQDKENYQKWFDAGAQRYLLRIESSNPDLFQSIHPNNELHDFNKRIKALNDLKELGYQLGTGVMIGLPGQTLTDLANDLLFFKELDVDMVGMGPYIEHIDTPLYSQSKSLHNQGLRYNLSLLMYSLLRIMMPDINIASTTALDAINPNGRLEALNIASNVLMPNLTPIAYTQNYHLYNNKPDSLHADALLSHIETNDNLVDHKIAFGETGDSKHFCLRKYGAPGKIKI